MLQPGLERYTRVCQVHRLQGNGLRETSQTKGTSWAESRVHVVLALLKDPRRSKMRWGWSCGLGWTERNQNKIGLNKIEYYLSLT